MPPAPPLRVVDLADDGWLSGLCIGLWRLLLNGCLDERALLAAEAVLPGASLPVARAECRVCGPADAAEVAARKASASKERSACGDAAAAAGTAVLGTRCGNPSLPRGRSFSSAAFIESVQNDGRALVASSPGGWSEPNLIDFYSPSGYNHRVRYRSRDFASATAASPPSCLYIRARYALHYCPPEPVRVGNLSSSDPEPIHVHE